MRFNFAAQPVRGVMRKCGEWHRYRSSDEWTEVPTNSTKWSISWEVDSFSDIQKSFRILWNLKCYSHVHKGSPPTSIMSQINPVHTKEVVTWTIVWWYSVLQWTVSESQEGLLYWEW
jgi:hypothetical protein